MKTKITKTILLTTIFIVLFALQSFATVWINTTELTQNGVTVVPNQSMREDTTVINFAGYDWYVIGTNGVDEMTLFAVDNWCEFAASNNWLNSTEYNALTQVEKDLIKSQTLDGVADLKLFALSKEEAEGVSNSIRGASIFWWTRTPSNATETYLNIFENSFISVGNSYYRGTRPAVTIDITGIDISSSSAVAKVVNRGNMSNKNAVNVNTIPVTKGTVTIIPNQDVSRASRQEISFGGITWYAIGSNGKDKVTLLAKKLLERMQFRASNSNEYFSSDVRTYLQDYLINNMSSVSSAMEPVLLNDTIAPGETRKDRYSNYYVDTYYQSDKLFLLSKYEIRDLHQSIRVCATWNGRWLLRSPFRIHKQGVWFVSADGLYVNWTAPENFEGVRPALVLNLSSVNLSSTTGIDGVETITATMAP